MGLHLIKMFLQSKESHQQNKKTTHRMGEHTHHTSKTQLIAKIYKEFIQLKNKKTI